MHREVKSGVCKVVCVGLGCRVGGRARVQGGWEG